jgi:hypothetical protein
VKDELGAAGPDRVIHAVDGEVERGKSPRFNIASRRFSTLGIVHRVGCRASEATHHFTGIDQQGIPGAGDLKPVVMAEADEIMLPCGTNQPANVVEVMHRDAPPTELDLGELAMDGEMGKLARIERDAKAVAIVVAKDDVDWPGKALAQPVDDERGAEVAAAEERAGILYRSQDRVEIAEMIVNIGNDRDTHCESSLG